MHSANNDNAPPPPYRAHGFGDAPGSSTAPADAQGDLIDLGDHISGTPSISPPSYEASYNDHARSSSETIASPSVLPEKKSSWNYADRLTADEGSSSSATSSLDCGHWASRGCSMTSGPRRCCSCLDRREHRPDGRYPVYVDGMGDRFGSTTRWAHYCTPCKEYERAAASSKGTTYVGDAGPPDVAAMRRARREARRQAKIDRTARMKAKDDAADQIREAQARLDEAKGLDDQNQIYYMTHTKKHIRRERHAERARIEQEERERVAKDAADLTVLRDMRRQAQLQAADLERQLAEKRARVAHLDHQIRMRELRAVPAPAKPAAPGQQPSMPQKSDLSGMSASDRSAIAEKAALADSYRDHRRETSTTPATATATRFALSSTNAYEPNRQVAAGGVAANLALPPQAEKPGGFFSSAGPSSSGGADGGRSAYATGPGSGPGAGHGSSSSGWLGRMFGRGKGKEREREPAAGETYYGEHFYARKRAEIEAAAQAREYTKEKK
ncbi:uncharacterized protein SPSK_04254 [Sporothrix schenckii 1099-18]|uniref:Uncharacterized protein n=2 Tax=Sporothrix schenckii TaxID=29908 RepID=U7PTW0_SPOS1|nr:uncharacterized protein SPSK_04254 [Sporothrix schenckii 1099-18]ERS99068.1 hypothetical protein HMPREF1624_04263 [Sporothrix schenckii ATCC 58251]KJR83278.1 hypothetical protein SPSK_04254 [Sporothrix schenckii 1099-18]